MFSSARLSNDPVLRTSASQPSTATGQLSSPIIDVFANCVYYGNWRIYRGESPSSINLNLVSHLCYAFAWPRVDGSVNLSDEWADVGLEVEGRGGCLGALAGIKSRYPHIRLLLSIGGGGVGSQSFSALTSSPEARERFGKTAKALIDQYQLDGIDVNWEHPTTPQEGMNYVALLGAVRNHLPAGQYTVSCALSAGTWVLRNIELSVAHHFLDQIHLMSYDFCGPWVDTTGHQAQLYAPARPHSEAARVSCHSAVQYLRQHNVPLNKVILGIPLFGRSFLGASGPGQAYTGHGGSDGTFDYKELPRPGTVTRYDASRGAAYCIGGDGGFVSFDDPQAVRAKAQYVMSNGLRGLFYWNSTGDKTDSQSLIETGFRILHR